MVGIRPCECGGEGKSHEVLHIDGYRTRDGYMIACDVCGRQGRTSPTQAGAKRKWNTLMGKLEQYNAWYRRHNG